VARLERPDRIHPDADSASVVAPADCPIAYSVGPVFVGGSVAQFGQIAAAPSAVRPRQIVGGVRGGPVPADRMPERLVVSVHRADRHYYPESGDPGIPTARGVFCVVRYDRTSDPDFRPQWSAVAAVV